MKKYLLYILPLFFVSVSGCNKDNPQASNPVPYVAVNRQINMDNPQYIQLNQPGGFVYLEDGYKGIIVTRDYADQYHAVDRACPFHPDENCARVTVESSGLGIRCGKFDGQDWIPCCNSKYGLDGALLEGPSKFPLRMYVVTKSGSVLSITNY